MTRFRYNSEIDFMGVSGPEASVSELSICIMRLSAIGDVTHVVPVVRAIRSHNPDARITWIIGKTEATLMADILAQARARDWTQSQLAARAGLPDSSISRIKRSGRADLDTLARLAAALGLRLTLVPDHDYAEKINRGELF